MLLGKRSMLGLNIHDDLKELLKKHVKLTLLTDSMYPFKVIINSIITTEKRLMIDISSVREEYERRNIDYIGWISSKFNLANGLKKFGICSTLTDLLRSDDLHQEI